MSLDNLSLNGVCFSGSSRNITGQYSFKNYMFFAFLGVFSCYYKWFYLRIKNTIIDNASLKQGVLWLFVCLFVVVGVFCFVFCFCFLFGFCLQIPVETLLDRNITRYCTFKFKVVCLPGSSRNAAGGRVCCGVLADRSPVVRGCAGDCALPAGRLRHRPRHHHRRQQNRSRTEAES